MQATRESLRARYAEMETEQLIELDRRSELTSLAQAVLDETLAERGITPTERTDLEQQIEHEHKQLVPLASLGARFVAQILDGVAALIILYVPLILLMLVGYIGSIGGSIVLIAYVTYLLFQDALPNGQSLGKRVLRLRVVNKTSRQSCGLGASFLRNILLLLLGPIDIVFANSRYKQRLGDRLAKTIVISA